jgi:rod shape-determining protein MreD
MRLLFLLALTYVALVADAAGNRLSVLPALLPHALYLVSAVSILIRPGTVSIATSAMAGLLADVLQGSLLGLNVVLLANLAFLAPLLGMTRSRSSVLGSSAFILGFVTIAGISSAVLGQLLHQTAVDASHLRTAGEVAISRGGGSVAVYLLVMLLWGALAQSGRLLGLGRSRDPSRPAWAR